MSPIVAGRRTSLADSAGSSSRRYDPLDRLTSIAGPTTAGYSYNGDGLRVSKIVGGATTTFAWDPSAPQHRHFIVNTPLA